MKSDRLLEKRTVKNEIFNDYFEYISDINKETDSYCNFNNIVTSRKATEGFYIKLQELLETRSELDSDWDDVNNQSGGFLCFSYHWKKTDKFFLYIQIENSIIGKDGIKLVVKISDSKPNIEILYQILSELQSYSQKHDLTLTKPKRFGAGETCTVAIIEKPFMYDNNNFDINHFIQTLIKLENVLNEYATPIK